MDVPGIYRRLLRTYGPQGWWPVRGRASTMRRIGYDPRFEVIIGAILTQMVAWTNVEKAIADLLRAGLVSPAAIRAVPTRRLEALVRPAGYYRQKTRTLKGFVHFLEDRHGGSLDRLFRLPVPRLREELLSVRGIGEETADSIILYAFGKPSFVTDAYTRRLCACFGLRFRTYGECQTFFIRRLPRSARLWNEYHALIVRWGKDYGKGDKKTSADACRVVGARKVRTVADSARL